MNDAIEQIKNPGPSFLASAKGLWKKSVEGLGLRLRPPTAHDLICTAHKLSEETDKCDKLLVYPMVMILLVTLACSPWSDSWHWGIWMWLLVALKLGLLVLFPVLLNRTAGKAREALNQLLIDKRIRLDPGASTGSLELEQELIDRLSKGCFAALHSHPVFAALAGVLGGSGIVNFLQPLLSGHW